jgi:hypothetical protein
MITINQKETKAQELLNRLTVISNKDACLLLEISKIEHQANTIEDFKLLEKKIKEFKLKFVITEEEKDFSKKENMIDFLKSVFAMDGFDYEKCYDDFISKRKVYKQDKNMNKECSHENKTQHFSDVFGHYISCKDCGKNF